jgi:hypothetical protein
METSKPTHSGASVFAPQPGESVSDYRARIEQRQAEALEERQRELAEQASDSNTPAARIRIWERLHQIALPRSPSHKILDVIAADTRLSVEEVRTEQRQRSLPPPRVEP